MLRVHDILPLTCGNGPGWRAALWLQGCTLGCDGCFNPQTHAAHGGRQLSVQQVLDELLRHRGAIEGITVSGGEPLQQEVALIDLLRRVRSETDLSVLLFTGYAWTAVRAHTELLSLVDVVLAGRYDATRRVAQRLIGSSNKTVHFLTSRYGHADLEAVPQAEAVITEDGDVIFSGIDPLTSRAALSGR